MDGLFKDRNASRRILRRLLMISVASILVIGVCLVGITSIGGSDSADTNSFTSGAYAYRITSDSDKTVMVDECTSKEPNEAIPSTVIHNDIEYKVTSIGTEAFASCESIITLHIPMTVEMISDTALNGCSRLKTIEVAPENPALTAIDGVLISKDLKTLIQFPCGKDGKYTIPDTIETIDTYSFAYSKSLTSLTVSEGVEFIGDHAFYNCTGLSAVVLPDTLTSIEWSAFEGCRSLSDINIPKNITHMGDYALAACNGIVSVTLPASLESLGDSVFGGCAKLTSIDVDPDNPVYSSKDGVLFSKTGDKLYQYPCAKSGGYTIPAGVTTICINSFAESMSLTSVTMDDAVEFIEPYAFFSCSSLESIRLSSKIGAVRSNVFDGCSSLTSIDLPETVTTIDRYAFHECTSLATINLPSIINWIGPSAFKDCPELENITLSENLRILGDEAFYGCIKLKSVDLSSRITYIPDSAFFNCRSLESVTIPINVTDINDTAFYGCVSLTSLTIPGNVNSIGMYSFYGCTGLTTLEILEGVTSIDDHCFSDCTGIRSVKIPASLVNIEDNSFGGCVRITAFEVDPNNEKISSEDGVLFNEGGKNLLVYPCAKKGEYVIPEHVKTISEFAFNGCIGLTSIRIPHSDVVKEWSIFNDCSSLVKIIVPQEDDGVTTINGVVYSKDLTSVKRVPEGKTGTLTLQPSVKEFGDYSFYKSKIDTIVITGGDTIKVNPLSFSECDQNLVFESGREGYGVELYADQEMTEKASIIELSIGEYDTLYLEWTGSPSPPAPTPDVPETEKTQDNFAPVIIGGVIAALVIVGAAMYIMMRRRP